MRESSFYTRRTQIRLGLVALAFAVVFLSIQPLRAQTPNLKQTIESRYEVLPVSGGLLLRPTAERLGVRTVELKGSEVSVNGERVSAGVLRAWLGAEAEPLLELAALAPSERRAMFNLASGAREAAPNAGETIEGVPTPPAAPTEPAEPVEPGGEDVSSTTTAQPDEDAQGDGGDVSNVANDATDSNDSNDAKARIGTILRFGGSATVDEDEIAEEVVTIGGPIRVDGQVERDVTAIGASVTVNGKVEGEVTSVGGTVHLGPNSYVSGDVTSVGGTIDRDPGAQVDGRLSETSGRGPHFRFDDDDFEISRWGSPFFRVGQLIWSILSFGILGLLVALVVTLAREPVQRIDAKLVAEPWQCLVAGIASQLLFFPLLVTISVVLLVSIIGIPLLALIPFALVGLALAAFLGFSAVAQRVGRLIERRFDRPQSGVVTASLIGLLALASFYLVGRVLGIGGGPLEVFSWMFWILGVLILYIAGTIGFGAAILTRFGLGPRRVVTDGSGAAVADSSPLAPLPPLPETPEVPKAHETQSEE